MARTLGATVCHRNVSRFDDLEKPRKHSATILIGHPDRFRNAQLLIVVSSNELYTR